MATRVEFSVEQRAEAAIYARNGVSLGACGSFTAQMANQRALLTPRDARVRRICALFLENPEFTNVDADPAALCTRARELLKEPALPSAELQRGLRMALTILGACHGFTRPEAAAPVAPDPTAGAAIPAARAAAATSVTPSSRGATPPAISAAAPSSDVDLPSFLTGNYYDSTTNLAAYLLAQDLQMMQQGRSIASLSRMNRLFTSGFALLDSEAFQHEKRNSTQDRETELHLQTLLNHLKSAQRSIQHDLLILQQSEASASQYAATAAIPTFFVDAPLPKIPPAMQQMHSGFVSLIPSVTQNLHEQSSIEREKQRLRPQMELSRQRITQAESQYQENSQRLQQLLEDNEQNFTFLEHRYLQLPEHPSAAASEVATASGPSPLERTLTDLYDRIAEAAQLAQVDQSTHSLERLQAACTSALADLNNGAFREEIVSSSPASGMARSALFVETFVKVLESQVKIQLLLQEDESLRLQVLNAYLRHVRVNEQLQEFRECLNRISLPEVLRENEQYRRWLQDQLGRSSGETQGQFISATATPPLQADSASALAAGSATAPIASTEASPAVAPPAPAPSGPPIAAPSQVPIPTPAPIALSTPSASIAPVAAAISTPATPSATLRSIAARPSSSPPPSPAPVTASATRPRSFTIPSYRVFVKMKPRKLKTFLRSISFITESVRGSHAKMARADGTRVTVATHGQNQLKRGTSRGLYNDIFGQ